MTQRRLRNRRDFSHSKQQIIDKMFHWLLVALMVFQQLKTTAALKFKGDTCLTKNKTGNCKGWSECSIMKTLIQSGEYTNREVVSCGFDVKEELICCPVDIETKSDTSTKSNEDRSGDHSTRTTTTTETPINDFWLHLQQSTTSTTTARPDFWLDLLKPTSTTTRKPLMLGKQKLNENSEFYDFNALLGGNQNGKNKSQRQSVPLEGTFNQGNFPVNGMGPVNTNQWGRDQMTSNFNKEPGVAGFNNGPTRFVVHGNDHIDWSQQINGKGPMNGNLNVNRGPQNFNAPFSNGHANFNGPDNNGRFRNSWSRENDNQAFAFSQNNLIPHYFFGEQNGFSSPKPVRPVNEMQEQNPFLAGLQKEHKPNIQSAKNNNKNDDEMVDDLIKNIFANSEFEEKDSNDVAKGNLFTLNKPKNPFINIPQNTYLPQPAVWQQTAQNNNNNHNHNHNHNNHEPQFVQFSTMSQQQKVINPQVSRHFEIIPAAGNQINANGLEKSPSRNFMQQPTVAQTWPTPHLQPVQVGNHNFFNPGMNYGKGQANQLPTDSQAVAIEPLSPTQKFIQQMQSRGNEARSTSPQTLPNVQPPPRQALNPFKPSEFRPPPALGNNFSEDNNSLSVDPIPWPDPKTSKDRPVERACKRIKEGLNATLSQHILGGTPAELGEFPHMVAIGYSRIGGDNKPPYDIRCGGTLIDKRFVLTAAHCVSDRESVPAIVRLGVVNFKDETQMAAAVELRIKQTYIHDDYRTRLTYNDIAILELESDVTYNENIYPICLHNDLKDPDPKIKLWVTGWGTVNTTTRSFSDILLKAPLHTAPIEYCNKSFTDYGLNRKIPEGIRLTQFCAEDKDQVKDACQGDSGGPLILIVDESYKNYRLVGVVSSGFGCASSTPGLYTRVAAYLDFIEKHVWSNGGD